MLIMPCTMKDVIHLEIANDNLEEKHQAIRPRSTMFSHFEVS